MKRRLAAHVCGVDVAAQIDQDLHDLHRVLVRPAVLVDVQHVNAGRCHERRRVLDVGEPVVSAARDQQTDHLGVGSLGCEQKRGRADAVEAVPIAVDDFLRHARVHVGAPLDQRPSEVQTGQAAGRHRIRELTDVERAGPRNLMQGRPSLRRGIGVGSAVEEKRAELPVRVDRSDDQRARSVRSGVVRVGAAIEEGANGGDVPRTHGKEQRCVRIDPARAPVIPGDRRIQPRLVRCCASGDPVGIDVALIARRGPLGFRGRLCRTVRARVNGRPRLDQ